MLISRNKATIVLNGNSRDIVTGVTCHMGSHNGILAMSALHKDHKTEISTMWYNPELDTGRDHLQVGSGRSGPVSPSAFI